MGDHGVVSAAAQNVRRRGNYELYVGKQLFKQYELQAEPFSTWAKLLGQTVAAQEL